MSDKDVHMKEAAEEPAPSASTNETILKEIDQSFLLLSKAGSSYDNRYISKVFRDLGPLRRKIRAADDVLPSVVAKLYPSAHTNKVYLLEALGAEENVKSEKADEMEVDSTSSNSVNSTNAETPEAELYVHLLVQVYLLDTNQLAKADTLNANIIQLMKLYNRRSLDFIQAKIWFFIARTKELLGDLVTIRPELLSSLRTATLRHDTETTASIITLLLRNYLLSHDISQAANLVEKTEFPENAGNALVARYYYYLARINSCLLYTSRCV